MTPESEPAQPEEEAKDENDFRAVWAEELMKHAWQGLERIEQLKGQPYHSLLLYRARNPEVRSEAIARQLRMTGTRVFGTLTFRKFTETLGRPISAANARQIMHRGTEMLSDLLIEEIVRSLRKTPQDPVSADAVEAELIDLKLLDKHRREALDRYRSRG